MDFHFQKQLRAHALANLQSLDCLLELQCPILFASSALCEIEYIRGSAQEDQESRMLQCTDGLGQGDNMGIFVEHKGYSEPSHQEFAGLLWKGWFVFTIVRCNPCG